MHLVAVRHGKDWHQTMSNSVKFVGNLRATVVKKCNWNNCIISPLYSRARSQYNVLGIHIMKTKPHLQDGTVMIELYCASVQMIDPFQNRKKNLEKPCTHLFLPHGTAPYTSDCKTSFHYLQFGSKYNVMQI